MYISIFLTIRTTHTHQIYVQHRYAKEKKKKQQ